MDKPAFTLTDDAEFAIRDAASSLTTLGVMIDEGGPSITSVTPGDYAALFRTLGRQLQAEVSQATPYFD